MIYTDHANDRINQRGFRKEDLQLIERYGEAFSAKGNAIRLRIPTKRISEIRKELRNEVLAQAYMNNERSSKRIKALNKQIQSLDKIRNKELIYEPDCDVVITAQINKKHK